MDIWFLDPDDAVATGDDIYCLDFKEGDRAGEIIDIEQVTTLGRAGCNISFSDTGVSSRHAEVRVLGANAVFVRDLGSSNGTFVNGVRISGAMRLKPGDQVQLGQTVVALRRRGVPRPEGLSPGQPALMVEPTRLLTMEDVAEPEPERDVLREAEPPEAVVEHRPEIPGARASKRLTYLALVVVGVVVLALLWIVLGKGPSEQPQQLQVVAPSLSGLRVEQAKKVLKPWGLTMVVAGERRGERGEKKGVILSQMPPDGVKIKKGLSVSVVVSSGRAQVTVPTLARLPLERAKAALGQQGLQVGSITREASEDLPRDQIIRSSPSSGTKLELAGSVDLVVSDGEAMVAVPEVVHKRLGAAKAAISGAGLRVGRITYTYDDRRGRLVVLKQTPATGKPVAKDTRVDLVVNEGD